MWGLSTLVIGGLFGWLAPGVQHRHRVHRTGLVLGIVVAALFVLIGAWTGWPPLGIGLTPSDMAASAIGMAVLFEVGVWIGDVLNRYASMPG